MSRRLKEAGAPLHPRIDSEIANHLGYVDGALKGREFFVGHSLTGADIQMSFVGEMAKVFDKLGPYPNLSAWLSRMHARPAFQRSVEKGGAYRFAQAKRACRCGECANFAKNQFVEPDQRDLACPVPFAEINSFSTAPNHIHKRRRLVP